MVTDIQAQICEMYVGLGVSLKDISDTLNVDYATVCKNISRYFRKPKNDPIIISMPSKINWPEGELDSIIEDMKKERQLNYHRVFRKKRADYMRSYRVIKTIKRQHSENE